MEWVLPRIARDLLLFENQLPFFVLVKLFRMRESRNSGTSTDPSICKLSHLALQFFHSYLPFKWNAKASNYNSKEKIGDLVCLMHEALVDKALIPSLPKMVWKRLEAGFRFKNARFEHLLGLIHATISISILDPEINEAKVELKKAGIFEHLFVLISKAVIPLHAEREDMSNQEPFLRPEGLEGDSEENMEVETDQGWESIDQFCSELKEAGITFKMAKKFKDHVNEIQAWEKESIPHAFELQEARIEFNEAKTFKNLLNRIHPAEDQNSRLYSELLSQAGVEPKKAKTFVSLLEIEDVNIHGATELQEAGIKLRKSENDNMFSIKFNNGLIPLMEVSPLSIEDQTETCLRNLIAYEQYCDMDKSLNYVTNYVLFMDSLINSSKDVELLRQRGIIQNYLGDDVAISTTVNKLCDNINLSNYNIYSRTSRNLNMHCRGFWNKQMAKLKRDYFSSPWAWISFLAGVLLLVLTIVQTIFSIIP